VLFGRFPNAGTLLDIPSYVVQTAAGCGACKEGNFMYDSGGASSKKLRTP
jgi:hypothetical protein